MLDEITLDLRVPSGPRAAAAARHSLHGLDQYLEPSLREQVELLVTELVTNSFRHAGADGPFWIGLKVVASARTVRAEVVDPGRGFRAGPTVPDAGETSGWGLYLVDRIASRWGVRGGDVTCVWFEMNRAPEAGAHR